MLVVVLQSGREGVFFKTTSRRPEVMIKFYKQNIIALFAMIWVVSLIPPYLMEYE